MKVYGTKPKSKYNRPQESRGQEGAADSWRSKVEVVHLVDRSQNSTNDEVT
jgi:hypothetical protein